jgi:hypothetical protein
MYEEAAKKAGIWYATGRMPKAKVFVSVKNEAGELEIYYRVSWLQRF